VKSAISSGQLIWLLIVCKYGGEGLGDFVTCSYVR